MSDRINLFPDMAPWEFEALVASIKRNGPLLPVYKDENGDTIDGRQRERAYRELGIKDYPVVTLAGLTEEEKRDWAFVLNYVRRKLNEEQMRGVIAAELRRTPDVSSNWLAQTLGTTGKTVEKVRRKLIATSEIPKFEKLRGKDGKCRRVTRVTTNTVKELGRAQEALRSLGDDAPKRPIELRLLERKAARQAARERVACEPVITLGEDAIQLYHCPFQRIEETAGISPDSVNLISTDFPYDGGFLDQLPALAKLAEWALVPGGLFVTYCGQYHLDRVIKVLGERLSYRWVGASAWRGVGVVIHRRQVTSKWKPILVYSKGDWTKRKKWHDLTLVNHNEKRWHPWQQPLDVVERLIRDFSRPGDLIVDPCGGGFTTAVACRWLRDRRCISCDIDGEAVRKGRERLALEGVTDARQSMRELIGDAEVKRLVRGHVVRAWTTEHDRTKLAFRDYLHALGPEWVKRFKALGEDQGKAAVAG